MTEKLRFAIVGCGVIGPTHAEAINSLPDVELVVVCDIFPYEAARIQKEVLFS